MITLAQSANPANLTGFVRHHTGNRNLRRRSSGREMRTVFSLGVLLLSFTSGACRRQPSEVRQLPAVVQHVNRAKADADHNGIPDGIQLASYDDREAFRSWFTAIAELQFYHLSAVWNSEQRDCAGLVRFAMREALRKHDRLWYKKMGPAYEQVSPDVRSVSLDGELAGEKIFRTGPGAFRESDLTDGTFTEFADAKTLKEFNSDFVSRDRQQARPGDLLFFYRPWVQKFPYHVMIFLGTAREAPENADDWVVYHTGASPTDEGTVKKVRLSTLDHHPDPRWRPIAGNRNFLGFYRLKILK